MISPDVDKNPQGGRLIAVLILTGLLTVGLYSINLWFPNVRQVASPGPIPNFAAEFSAAPIRALAFILISLTTTTIAVAIALFGRINRQHPAGATLALCFLVGFTLAGTLIALIGQMALPGIFFFMFLGLTIAVWHGGAGFVIRLPDVRRFRWELWLWLPLVLLVVVAALGPMVESDGLRYHVAAAEAWKQNQRVVLLPYSANSNLPLLSSAVATLAPLDLIGRGYQLCQALCLLAGSIVAGWAAASLYRIAGGRRVYMPAVAAATSLLCLAFPVVAVVGGWPFSDVASAALLAGALYIILPGAVVSFRLRLALFSLLLGGAVAAKISILPMAGLLACAIMVIRWKRVWNARSLIALILPGLIVLSPWLIKNYRFHENPVYPLAYGILGGGEWNEENVAFYQDRLGSKGTDVNVVNLVRSPYDVIVEWNKYEQQNPGPAVMFLLVASIVAPLIVLKRSRKLVVALVACLLIAWLVWFLTYQSVRFLIPHLWLMSVIGAATIFLAATRFGRGGIFVVRLVLAGMALVGASWAVLYNITTVPVYKATLGLYNPTVYTAIRFNAYPAIQWLNENSERNDAVFYVGEHRRAYAWNYTPVLADWFDTPIPLVFLRQRPDLPLMEILSERGFVRILYNEAELSLYEKPFYQPRFSTAEWERFEAFRSEMRDLPVEFDTGNGVRVYRLQQEVGEP